MTQGPECGRRGVRGGRPLPRDPRGALGVHRQEPDLSDIAVGRGHVCARRRSGAVSCWTIEQAKSDVLHDRAGGGPEDAWQSRTAPVSGATAVDVGSNEACAVVGGGRVTCWTPGDPRDAALRPIEGLRGAREISLADGGGCAVRTDGSVACWDPTNRVVRSVAGLSSVEQITAGRSHGCALRRAGDVLCFALDGRSTPRPVGAAAGARTIGADGDRTCAVLPGARVICWTEASPTPITVWPASRP